MKIIKLICFLFCLSPLSAKLEEPLKDNGGYHFQFEGTRYVITMDVQGNIYFMSKKMLKDDPAKAKKNRILLRFSSREIKPNNYKWVTFNKLETQIKQSSSKFKLTLVGEMEETGVKFASIIEGSKSKMVLITQMTRPEKVSFHMGFHVPEALEEFSKKGLVVKLSNKKEKITHICKDVYETQHYRVSCRQVLVQNRNPLSLIFDSGKAEGYFTVQQHSHHQGGVLNNPFSIYYNNGGSQNWDPAKNTFIFSF